MRSVGEAPADDSFVTTLSEAKDALRRQESAGALRKNTREVITEGGPILDHEPKYCPEFITGSRVRYGRWATSAERKIKNSSPGVVH